MPQDIIVGLDAGTSVIKSVAFGRRGEEIAEASIANSYSQVGDGGVEQDMAATWDRAATTLRQLAERVPDLPARILAIAVTGQGDGTWLVDAAGEPVAPAWLWLDSRAASLVETLRAAPQDRRRFELTGTGLAACHQGPQLAVLAQQQPDLIARAATAMHCKDWLYFRLTGERITDPSEGTLSYGDFRTRAYDDEVLEILGIAKLRRLLPPIRDGIAHRGALSAAAATQTGLRAGTPIVPGYIDIVCSALGTGVLDRGARAGCSIIGSTGMHIRLATSAAAVRLAPQRTGYTLALPSPGCFAQTQSNLAGSVNLDWIAGLIGEALEQYGAPQTRAELLAGLDRLMAAGAPGALLYHPFIAEAGERGPFLDASARAGLIGLSQRHGLADLVRAIAEGLCLAARDCYAAIGDPPSELRLCGGVARSGAFRAILAAVLGVPIRRVRREETGAAGAAMIAAVSFGLYPDLEHCSADWVDPLLEPPEAPDDELCRRYDALFETYRQSIHAMQPVWQELRRTR